MGLGRNGATGLPRVGLRRVLPTKGWLTMIGLKSKAESKVRPDDGTLMGR